MNRQELKTWIFDNLYHFKSGELKLNSHLSRVSWWSNRGFEKILDDIYKFTVFLDDSYPIVARIKSIENDCLKTPSCKVCGNFVKFTKGHFNTYCSKSCSSKDLYNSPFKDKSVLDKMKTTYIKNNKDFPFSKDAILRNNRKGKKLSYESKMKRKQACLERYGSSDVGVDTTTISNYTNKHGIERQLEMFLQGLSLSYKSNDRNLISSYELDFVIPEKKVAIEFCGLYWHSDKFLDKNYHLNKLEMCLQCGYRLVTIFEDEWDNDQAKIRRFLLNLLGLSYEERIYARKTRIIEVSHNEAKVFFKDNHIQGSGIHSIHYGLLYNNELVACIGIKDNKNGLYEINRFATACKVVGAFGKLLNHFKHNHQWYKIVTFADRRYSEGDLYHKTGFFVEKILNPDYRYTKGLKTFHKFGFRRESLSKKLGDFDPSLTEYENCNRNGYHRIFDCGKYRFVMEKATHEV